MALGALSPSSTVHVLPGKVAAAGLALDDDLLAVLARPLLHTPLD